MKLNGDSVLKTNRLPFILLFIVTLHTKYQTDDLKFTINDETDERTY